MTQQARIWVVVLIVAVLLVLVAIAGIGREPNTPLGQRDVGRSELGLWALWSGVAGGVLVFGLTTVTGWEVRRRQRGRELRGLSRVLRAEMKHNSNTIGVLTAMGGFDRNTYLDERPTRDAWLDTRVRLAQLMQEDDFANLARFYVALEVLDVGVTRDHPIPEWLLPKAQGHEHRAMQVVEGYCNAKWLPFKGFIPDPTPTEAPGKV